MSFIIIIFFKEVEWFNWRFHAYTMVNLPPGLCCVVDVYATRNISHLDILSALWLEIIERHYDREMHRFIKKIM